MRTYNVSWNLLLLCDLWSDLLDPPSIYLLIYPVFFFFMLLFILVILPLRQLHVRETLLFLVAKIAIFVKKKGDCSFIHSLLDLGNYPTTRPTSSPLARR